MCSTRKCYEQQAQKIQEQPFKDAFKIEKADIQITILVIILMLIGVAFWMYETNK